MNFDKLPPEIVDGLRESTVYTHARSLLADAELGPVLRRMVRAEQNLSAEPEALPARPLRPVRRRGRTARTIRAERDRLRVEGDELRAEVAALQSGNHGGDRA